MPDLDDRAIHIWAWYVDLDASRASGGFGPSPITYADIAAYIALTGEEIHPWEVRAIRAMDDAVLSHIARKSKQASSGKAADVSDPLAVAAMMQNLKGKP